MSHARLEFAVARAALERAHAARLRDDLDATLDELLAAWAAVRDGHIADAIGMIGHEARGQRPPVTDESQWLHRCTNADAIEVGRLLDKLPRRLSLLLPGLERLAARPPDPRLASVAMRLRDIEPWLLGEAFMAPHLDPIYLTPLRNLRDLQTRPARRERIAASVDEHERLSRVRATVLDPGGRAWVDAITAREPGPRCADARELALLVEILAAPRDMGPRAVYADLLLQRGELFGELVTLQLRLEHDPSLAGARERIDALLAAHGRTWLGKLTQILDLDALEWRAGFGWRGALLGRDGAPRLDPRCERWLDTHPGLRTFVELDGASEALMAALHCKL